MSAGGRLTPPPTREICFATASRGRPPSAKAETLYHKFRSADGDLAKTSGRRPVRALSAGICLMALWYTWEIGESDKLTSGTVDLSCSRTSPDHQPRSIDLSNKNGITPTWTIPLSSCCGGLKPDTTTIFRKKSPLARSDAVS